MSADIKNALNVAIETFGRLDVAFNNAGIEQPVTPLAELSEELWDRVIAQEPVGRMGRPEEIAGAVLWLCSERTGFVTGHAMVMDGGQTAGI